LILFFTRKDLLSVKAIEIENCINNLSQNKYNKTKLNDTLTFINSISVCEIGILLYFAGNWLYSIEDDEVSDGFSFIATRGITALSILRDKSEIRMIFITT